MRSKSRSGLLAACDDPNLLAFPLWPRQRGLLAAIDTGPRLHLLALGRRSGKTLAALLAVHDCLLRPHLATYLRPREKRYSVAVATSKSQAGIFLDAARVIVESSHRLVRRHTPKLRANVLEILDIPSERSQHGIDQREFRVLLPDVRTSVAVDPVGDVSEDSTQLCPLLLSCLLADVSVHSRAA